MEKASSPDRVRELCQQLESGVSQCSMNCYDPVGRKSKIWSCGTCFHVFHLKCVALWSQKQSDSFFCPQCRQIQEPPTKYMCFCGKVENPPLDVSLTPHSCGRTCGKKRKLCPHPCPLPCHPGPCPPCSSMRGPIKCPCSSTSYTYRCGTEDPRKTCQNVCGKKLTCTHHTCAQTCHFGDCEVCFEEKEVSCSCGKEVRSLLCGSKFSCEEKCGKQLTCGNHTCSVVCHSGECPLCPLSPEVQKTCFCGKLPLADSRLSCTDPIPSCGKPCGRALACGQHKCQQICHPGECSPCSQRVEARCACGKSKKQMRCADRNQFRCDRSCCTKLSCQRHTCMTKCCKDCGLRDAVSHICSAPCDKKFPCGHACSLACHVGRCPPCSATIPTFLTCRCGFTLSDPPPLPCGTKPPECSQPCRLSLPCGHSSPHVCHYGECPPCKFMVEKMCLGNHHAIPTPCSTESISCTNLCDKELSCGHRCPKDCHSGACLEEGKHCKVPCGKQRETCNHLCKRLCHFNEPCSECNQKVQLSCQCGLHCYYEKCSVARVKYPRDTLDEESYNGVLECNDNCLFEKRKDLLLSLKRTGGPELPFIYLAPLYVEGAANLQFLQSTEARLRDFLSESSAIASFPPAPGSRRKLIHMLAPYYRVSVESVDNGDLRSCLIRKTIHSMLPTVTLSSQIKAQESDPVKFISKNRKNKAKQLIAKCSAVVACTFLVTLLGSFTYQESDATDTTVHLFFVSSKRREEGCSLLLQNRVPIERCDDAPSLSG